MPDEGSEAAQLFDRLAESYRTDPTVTSGTGFGSNPGLRVGGKIFAMLVRRELAVKLPEQEVNALVAAGTGQRFDAGKGRPMREWVTVPVGHGDDWERLAGDAFAYVRSARPASRRRS